MYNNILIFDIETKKNNDLVDLIPLPKLKEAPKNYKDQSKIDAFEASAIVEQECMILEQRSRMSLDVDFAKIACIGIATSFEPSSRLVLMCRDLKEEIDALKKFWSYALYCNLIGYNIIYFDLPIIIRRSMMLGVRPSFLLEQNRAKYADNIIDLQLKLYNNGYVTNMNNQKPFARKQEAICKILGIENPLIGIDGSMVKNMTDQELFDYNMNDLLLTQQLAAKMQGYYF